MDYNNLKSVGKIYDFDGEAGTIVTPDAEYIFNAKQIKRLDNVRDQNFVSFYPSTVKFGNETFYVAREIETIEKEDIRTLKK